MKYKAHMPVWTGLKEGHCDAVIEIYFEAGDYADAVDKAAELLSHYTYNSTPVTAYRRYAPSITLMSEKEL